MREKKSQTEEQRSYQKKKETKTDRLGKDRRKTQPQA